MSHLTSKKNGQSDLIKLMQKGICFTTVINASELLYVAENEFQTKNIRDVLNAMKVLGLNSRYALKIPEIKIKVNGIRDILILIVAKSNNLPIITYEKSRYDGVGVEIYHPEEVGG
jgi:predicted nucleic acid-binding protein